MVRVVRGREVVKKTFLPLRFEKLLQRFDWERPQLQMNRGKFPSLGDQFFCKEIGIKLPFLAGAMAGGISGEKLVVSIAAEGMLGFFGAAGLSLEVVDRAIQNLQKQLD